MPKVNRTKKAEWIDDLDPAAALREVMDGTPVPACKACGDTGLDSKGRPCHPCVVAGRVIDESQLNDPFA